MKKQILLMFQNLKMRPRFPGFVLVPLLLLLTSAAFAQTVRGKVADETGSGMPGVNILVKGTTSGTVTDANGSYSITVPADAQQKVLIYSFIGYTTKEEAIGERTTVDVALAADATQLSEVVVVGYGTQRKRDVTGAIVSVSAETLKEVPASNVLSQLKGRAAGVDIVSNGSTPGATGSIRIRGNRSMATTSDGSNAADQPLIVVDGIPYGGNIQDLNSDDIASMEILKDASATAIYGSRGSGGVILITMKKGKRGPAIISFDTYTGTSNVMGKLNVMNGTEYAAFKEEARIGNNTAPGTTSYALTTAEQAALAAGVSTNWQDQIYKQGYITNQQLGITGGSEGTQFSMGAGYFKESGVIPNQDFSRYTIRASVDHQINKKIKVGLTTMNMLSNTNTPGGAGVPSGLMRLTPLANPYNADGSVNLLPAIGSVDATVVSPLTLISKADAIYNNARRLRTFNSMYGEYEIIPGLKYRVNIGLNYTQDQNGTYNGPLTYTNTATSYAQANSSTTNIETFSYVWENVLTYEKTFKDVHRFGATGLFSAQKDHQQASSYNGTGSPADFVQNSNAILVNSLTANANNNFIMDRGLISYMGRVNYSYDNRYIFTATVRTDGSSVLAKGNQYFTYPALNAGWNIMNEKFMSNVSVINNLKLRGGWGVTSNQSISPYTTLGALNVSAYNFGPGSTSNQFAFLYTNLANPNLKWQSTSSWNIGVDFGILKNRITGSVEVYQQNTKDIILGVLLPQSNGASTITQNLGKTQNNGMEFTLSTVNIKTTSGFQWNTDMNVFFNREKIVELASPSQQSDIANGWFVGQPLTVIYDVKKIGIWQTGDAGLAAQTSPTQYAGQIRVQDLNGDGKIDQNDRQVIGNFQPSWEGGMTNKFTFKNFDLSILITARMGMKVLVPYVTADGGANGYPFFNQGRVNQLKTDYWTPTNPTNAFPRPDAGTDRLLFGSTLGYVDGSFIKCRTITFGYEIPQSVLSRLKIRSLRVYTSVNNPFIIYSPFVDAGYGPDPEGNGYGGGVTSPTAGASTGAPGRQISVNANVPTTRQFILGLNMKF